MNANDIALTQVDKLGFILAQIAELTAEADKIKDAIKDSATAGGAKVVEGNLFKAMVVEANRKTTDGFHYAGPLAEAVQLGNVATRFAGQKLEWDAARMKFPNFKAAEPFLTKEYRKGWKVTAA